MIIRQVSIFIGNEPGRLAEVTGVIAENNINMRALSLAETANSGKLRIIVDDPGKAGKALEENEIIYQINEVVSVLVDDRAGGLAGMLKILAENNIAIKYMYGFTGGQGKACMVLRISEEFRAKAADILKAAGYEGFDI